MAEVSTAKPRRAKRPPPKTATQSADGQIQVVNVPVLDRDERIAVAAYYRAESRHFEPGHELEDWLAAESEVDRQLITQPGAHTPI